jgi:nucleoid-associated protein EbfC
MFKGLGNLANIGAIMKSAQEMGTRMQALNEELKSRRATGAAGGGLVEVEVNGIGEVLAVRIDPTLVEKQDREMIEDLLPAAFNSAVQKANQLRAEAMQSITGGMQLPGLDDALSQFTGTLPGGESK